MALNNETEPLKTIRIAKLVPEGSTCEALRRESLG